MEIRDYLFVKTRIMSKSKWLLLACLFFVLSKTYAQNAEKKWAVGLLGGKTEYAGDLGFAPFHFNQPFFWNIGVKGSRYLNPSFNVALQATFGNHGYWEFENTTTSFRNHMFQTYASVEYKFANGYILPEDFILNPYLFAGLGFTSHNQIKGAASNFDMSIPLGLGLELRADKNWSLFWQSTIGFTTGDQVDLTKSKIMDAFMLHQIGVKISLGKAKDKVEEDIVEEEDTDKDGLPNSEDDCPTEKGTAANSGCPDTDEDGILDKDDDCPEVAGLQKFAGCPDTDKDGIQDSEDDCPEIAGKIELQGCPDTDGDGIADKDDKCPNQKGLAQFEGCPDTDKDGIIDSEDDCPDLAGSVANKGCPDTDGDGIIDEKDHCPETPGVAENSGCPKVEDKVKEVFDEALKGIQFNTNLTSIKKESFVILDKVAAVMTKYKDAKLTIEGHTDNQGADASNKTLSQGRAQEVLNYLVKKGISIDRMTAKGYGEEKPLADNATATGRAQNRRVEFILDFD